MAMTPAERVREYRARKQTRSIDVTVEALERLKAYQQRWKLPSLSVAINHAVTFSKPE